MTVSAYLDCCRIRRRARPNAALSHHGANERVVVGRSKPGGYARTSSRRKTSALACAIPELRSAVEQGGYTKRELSLESAISFASRSLPENTGVRPRVSTVILKPVPSHGSSAPQPDFFPCRTGSDPWGGV